MPSVFHGDGTLAKLRGDGTLTDMNSVSDDPTWQCVMIAWGEKYGPDIINHTVRAVQRHTHPAPRFVLITDRERPGLDPCVQTVPFDPWYLKALFRTRACQAKLVMFEKGVLPEDLPAVYIDLDTAVLGDLTRAVDLMDSPERILMLQSVVLQFGWMGRLVYRLTNKKRYARGNSSVVVFHPAHSHFIAESFRRLYDAHGGAHFRPMIADERFISWAAQERIERLPKSLALKFTNEYMHPLKALLYLRGALPWVKARRAAPVAVTLPGPVVKPDELVTFRDGMEIRDWKRRWLIWDRRTLGDMGERLQEYYAPLHPDASARD